MASNITLARPVTRPPAPAAQTRFVNGTRLGGSHWLGVAVILAIVLPATPLLWKRLGQFNTGPDFRIPYKLSNDYWLYEWGLQRLQPNTIAVVGDSVVWGEYVRPDGTLSHFLSEESQQPGKFSNAGVNGMFPLALEGLIRYYGSPLSGRKIILHCNLLWLSSPKADLQTQKEERFNHAELVPQFSPRIPCYKADLNHRLVAVVGRHFGFSQWAAHVQMACFGQKNLPAWTLEENGDPPKHSNAARNPFSQITFRVPSEPSDDPDRGSTSPRHKSWSASGGRPAQFDWVELAQSLQWAAFQRLVKLLQSRNNDVLVVVGPFNEHIVAEENRPAFRSLRDGVADWLGKNQIPFLLPEPLPSDLYADASHPLTDGYRLLAKQISSDSTFQKWLMNAQTNVTPASRK